MIGMTAVPELISNYERRRNGWDEYDKAMANNPFNIEQMQKMATIASAALTAPKTVVVERTVKPWPKKIITCGPATVVIWEDKTKTIIRLSHGEKPDPYAAFCIALAIKTYGTNSELKRIIKGATEVKKGK